MSVPIFLFLIELPNKYKTLIILWFWLLWCPNELSDYQCQCVSSVEQIIINAIICVMVLASLADGCGRYQTTAEDFCSGNELQLVIRQNNFLKDTCMLNCFVEGRTCNCWNSGQKFVGFTKLVGSAGFCPTIRK